MIAHSDTYSFSTPDSESIMACRYIVLMILENLFMKIIILYNRVNIDNALFDSEAYVEQVYLDKAELSHKLSHVQPRHIHTFKSYLHPQTMMFTSYREEYFLHGRL